MRRRQALAALGALAGALAGCGGRSDGQPTGTTGQATPRQTPSSTPTATATPTATPSPTPTATPSPTPTPAPEPTTHGLDERFVVDPEGEPFAYTVHGLRTAERLLTTAAPEGERFVVVDCTVAHLGPDSALLPVDDIWIRGSGVRRSVSISASNAAGNDPRLGLRSLAGANLTDTPTRGFVVFSDVPTSPDDYRLLFTPSGTSGVVSDDPTATHRVSVGSLGDLDRIE